MRIIISLVFPKKRAIVKIKSVELVNKCIDS